MLTRHAVLLTAPTVDPRLAPVYPGQRRATPLEPTLVEVFILNSLNLFRMNTFCWSPRFAQFWCNLNPFRINTCKSVSKQTTLSPFRMNTYKKHRGGGESPQTVNSLFTELLYLPKKRQRPFRSDGGICEKGAPSSGEKIVCCDLVVRGRRHRRSLLELAYPVFSAAALFYGEVGGHREKRRSRLGALNVRQRV